MQIVQEAQAAACKLFSLYLYAVTSSLWNQPVCSPDHGTFAFLAGAG